MLETVAIALEGVSKTYRHYARPLDRVRESLTGRRLHVERNSVSDVSMDVGRGEVVGIIGRNGAGKSTLLKMIAGVLQPTTGKVSVNGSVSSILELGTGFHPDLSGRENIVMGGMCLGLSRRQAESGTDSIIDFSELREVIDMPFRTYSTGMQARLTFATAIAVDPDILIIDEALSVGDNRFQLKSFNRIRDFKNAGKTILLVTHGMSAVTSFCDRAVLLDGGRVIADGDPNWVTSVYHHLQFGEFPPGGAAGHEARHLPSGPHESEPEENTTSPAGKPFVDTHAELEEERAPSTVLDFSLAAKYSPAQVEEPSRQSRAGYRYGDGRATIRGVAILDRFGNGPIRELEVGTPCFLILDCETNERVSRLYCGFLIRDTKGDTLFGSDTSLGQVAGDELLSALSAGEARRVVAGVQMWLAPGDYFLSAAATVQPGKQSDMWFDAYEFRVVGPAIQHTSSRAFLVPQLSVQQMDRAGCDGGVSDAIDAGSMRIVAAPS